MKTIDAAGNIHRASGVPGAGQFDGHVRTAPVGGLNENGAYDDEPTTCDLCIRPVTGEDGLCDQHSSRWGEVNVRVGARTPWGAAQHVDFLGSGAIFAGTAGHGGVKLSPERNAVIPPALRNSSGWYEEDCEVNIVGMYHPDLRWSSKATAEEFERSVKEWFPDKWEQATGGTVQPGESRSRDEQVFLREHESDFVTRGTVPSETDPDFLVVAGIRPSDGAKAEFLISRAEYNETTVANPGYGNFVVDLTRHRQLPPAPAQPSATRVLPERAKVAPDTVSATALGDAYRAGTITSAARDRAAKDLGKQYRGEDGSIHSVRDVITEHAVSLSATERDGRITYSIHRPTREDSSSFYSYPVTKATFDYLQTVGLADDRSDGVKASHAAAAAYATYERAAAEWDSTGTKAPRALARYNELAAEANRLHAAEREADIAEHGTFEEREAARKAAQRERELAAKIVG